MLKLFNISNLQKLRIESKGLNYGITNLNYVSKNNFLQQQNKRQNTFFGMTKKHNYKFNFSSDKIVKLGESIDSTFAKYKSYINVGLVLGGIYMIYYLQDYDKQNANKKSGVISPNMERCNVTPRSEWEKKVVEDGLTFYNMEGINWGGFSVDKYWNEEGAIKITQTSEQELIEASFELHNMCLELVETVVQDDNLLRLFEIPDALLPTVKKSWTDKKTDLMGRFDLAWDGNGPPKLLEYNADTPSVLVESAQTQLNWCKQYREQQKEVPINAFQSNYVDKALIEGFKLLKTQWDKINQENTLGIITIQDDEESKATAQYLKNIAELVGCKTSMADVKDFSFDYDINCSKVILSLKSEIVHNLLKLYPYEWLVNEIKQDDILSHDLCEVQTIEPAWKLILGNKAILPLLWAMYPGHKNLLPAYFEDPHKNKEFKQSIDDWISKPKFGREGEGVLFSHDFRSHQDFIDRTDEQPKRLDLFDGIVVGKSIYQQFSKLPVAQDRTILLSSWVINGMPAGLCFREDTNVVTNNNSCFIPHFVVSNTDQQRKYQFNLTQGQEKLREQLYQENLNLRIYQNVQIGDDPIIDVNQKLNNSYRQPVSNYMIRQLGSTINTKSNQNISSEELRKKREQNTQVKKAGEGGRVYKSNTSRTLNFGRTARASSAGHG